MDLSKLVRRKQKAEDDNNQQALAEACNKLGSYYMNELKYQEALGEFRQESIIHQASDQKMDFGRANRMIGECYMMMGKYQDALKHEDIFMKIAKQEKDRVEQQRAYASVGRCHLLQAEDKTISGSNDAARDLKSAETAFLKSLMICKDLAGGKEVSNWELADMQARLYMNIGVTMEQKQQLDDAFSYYETCIKLCKANDLYELQHSCLMASGHAYFLKKDDTSEALSKFNSALDIAKRLSDKNEKICETLLAKSGVFVKNGDFQSAKQTLKKAYKLNSPNVIDKVAIHKNLKVVLMLCNCEDELVSTNSFDYAKRKDLFERLGDGACKLKTYSKGIDFYLKMLEAAQLNGEGDTKLLPIYVSLYTTYIDLKDYKSAREYMDKEYELIKDEPKEACATLIGLGNLLDLAGKDFWEVETVLQKALNEARKTEDRDLERTVMIKLVMLCKSRHMTSLAEFTEQEAIGKGIDLTELSAEDTEYSEDLPGLPVDEISLELQLSTDGESTDNEQTRTPKPMGSNTRKKRPTMTAKKNAKGETRLHEACINGNYQLAKMLIDQGHALNVRDNAGWLPLHEAAIHGHRDVCELLLDNGAQSAINDKGGTSCDGITPLYDSASNGNLSVVKLLLDRGAKATVKTDFNETPLDALLRWHEEYGRKLNETEKEFYEEVKQRLSELCEKVGIEPSGKNANTGSSGYNSGKSRVSQNSQRKSMRFNTGVSDESDEEETTKGKEESIKKSARHEYKAAMNQLKNPHKGQRYATDDLGEKRKTAHLTVQEVDEDEWLDDDIGPQRKKQRIFDENLLLNRDDGSPEKTRSPSKAITRVPSKNVIDSDSDSNDDGNENFQVDAFDKVMNARGVGKIKQKRRTSATKSGSRPPSQPSLLDAGFARIIDVEDFTRRSPLKSSSTNSSFNESFGRPNAVEKQLIIKVQIENEKVIVPLNREATNELKISWLIEEAARRYYCIKGIRPELKLKTADGATLLETDPVSLILCLTEENLIHSEILDWKLPSLSNRYLEACSDLKCPVDHEINELLEINRTATHIDLSNQNLNASAIRPILKALQHQNCLLQLDVSSNFIHDDGIKLLAQTLGTLKQLHSLDVSGNMITESGLEFFCNALAKSPNPSDLKQLKFSFNPIQSTSLKHVSSLCQSKNVASLSLQCCELTDANRLDQITTVKCLDISYNHLTREGFKGFLAKLNPGNVEVLNFERCSSEPFLGASIAQFIASGCYATLNEINLSALNLTENEILDILRSLEKCEQLRSLDFSHQKQLTFLTLKYLLVSMRNPSLVQLKLIGCRSLQSPFNIHYNNDGHRQTHLRNVQLSLPVQEGRDDFVQKMKALWDDVSGCRGKINQEKNALHLLLDDEAENPFHL